MSKHICQFSKIYKICKVNIQISQKLLKNIQALKTIYTMNAHHLVCSETKNVIIFKINVER